MEVIGLSPDPLTIDGEEFDPARHFTAWRKKDGTAMTLLRLDAQEGLRAALAEVPDGNGRWQAVAGLLNGRGIRTIQGGTWTAENVRKPRGDRARQVDHAACGRDDAAMGRPQPCRLRSAFCCDRSRLPLGAAMRDMP